MCLLDRSFERWNSVATRSYPISLDKYWGISQIGSSTRDGREGYWIDKSSGIAERNEWGLNQVKRHWDDAEGKLEEQEKELEAIWAQLEQKFQGLEECTENEKTLLESQSKRIDV